MKKILGWIAVVGIGIVIYSQYQKVRKEKKNAELKK